MITKRSPLLPNPPISVTSLIRVLCIDDHAILIDGLKAQFAIEGRIQVIGSLSSAANLLEEVAHLHPDVVILDVEMPGPDVFQTAETMQSLHPEQRFVFLSAHLRDGYLAAAYRCGAWGYFTKGDDLQVIVDGIVELARSTAGTFVMGPTVRARYAGAAPCRIGTSHRRTRDHVDASPRPPVPLQSLTAREVQVLRLIGTGLSRNQIASELYRSVKTIDGHQERMMAKLNIHSRVELMRFAIREGLAEA